jgi:tRNA threonylcarbamoyladenosine biosynthesis protein TsaB
MVVLGFDTATPATALALRLRDGAVLRAREDPGAGERPGHATRLLPLAATLLAEAGLPWSAVGRIAVGVGPGTFTGLRIGVATARGLAQSLDVEAVGVSTLRTLAAAALAEAKPDGAGLGVLAVIDARRGEAFAAAYAEGRELSPPCALAPQSLGELPRELEREHWLAVGDGAIRFRANLEGAGVAVPEDASALHRVDAGALCELALQAPGGAPEALLPEYCRRPDAEIAREHAREPLERERESPEGGRKPLEGLRR